MTYEAFRKRCEKILMREVCVLKELCVEWRIGGQTGGSCWAEGEQKYTRLSGEPEPEFEELDKILEAICPAITFLQYKRLCQEVVKSSSRCTNDYYGNYTEYAMKKVDLRQLYDYLKEKKLCP